MTIVRVVGNVWATRKADSLLGVKFLVIQPVDITSGKTYSIPIVAADTIGAGMGETVIIVHGSSARKAAGNMDVAVDATVVGIVDDK